MEIPKDQMLTLLDHGLFNSAQLLGHFLVSSSSVVSDSNSNSIAKAENLVLLGDAFFRNREFRTSINTYKQALQLVKIIPKQNTSSLRTSLSMPYRSSSPSPQSFSIVDENEVKFKIASCHAALNENEFALLEMEGIPTKARNLPMHLMMGKLYRYTRHTRAATACFKECLRHCPYVLEAITALAELGVSVKDILSLFPQTPSKGGKLVADHHESNRWLQRYVEAQCCVSSNDYKGGLEIFTDLLQRFPNNVHILLEIGKVEAIIGKNDEAIVTFEKARSVDQYIVTYMDEYAMLLKNKSEYPKLNKLVHDLLNTDPTRPEVFVALSVLWERKDERGALSYAEKSIQKDARHVTGHIMKGNLLLSLNRPDAAAGAFRNAHELKPDIRSYQGLVHSYLAISKVKEALYIAREAMKTMPQSPKVLKLVGDVHAKSSSGMEKAKKFYEAALRSEPGYLGAALALAELHVVEGRNSDAVSLLERYLKDWADDSLHVKLAQVFAATNMLQEALSHYQAALRINPQNEAAKKGLDRLEKQMKGIDPDAPEEDDDNEADDGEGDQEETELL
ncbi:anaphase-promoting complex subunit 7 [Silene latifolia]|uniref:anaphase-promoting complex subunit 7 n=1 Tax=Silene latifolia TaxID=37657 RepID=UPI003D77DEBB